MNVGSTNTASPVIETPEERRQRQVEIDRAAKEAAGKAAALPLPKVEESKAVDNTSIVSN